MNSHWNAFTYDIDENPGSEDALGRLLRNQAAVFVLRDNSLRSGFAALTTEILRRRDRALVSQYSNCSLTTIGTYLARHLADPARYFDASSSANDLFATQKTDLRALVRARLKSFLQLNSLNVASESGDRLYAPAVVRIHADGVSNPLHNDNIVRDAARTGLVLSRLRYQFSCVSCLQECDLGGELLHYQRRWCSSDEVFKVKDGLGYHPGVVENAQLCEFRPSTGDVYIMDPTNYHAIRAVLGGVRITMGFFFGFFDEDCKEGVCWC